MKPRHNKLTGQRLNQLFKICSKNERKPCLKNEMGVEEKFSIKYRISIKIYKVYLKSK